MEVDGTPHSPASNPSSPSPPAFSPLPSPERKEGMKDHSVKLIRSLCNRA